MTYFPGRGVNQRRWAIDDHRNRELDMIYAKEKKILAEMDAVMEQGKAEAKSFKEMLHKNQESRVASGRDVGTDKLSQRLAQSVEVSGWDGVSDATKTKAFQADEDRLSGNLDAQIRAEGFKEQMIECQHPDCHEKVRASDGYCSRIHETSHIAMQHTRDVSKPDKEESLPTMDDLRWGRKPLSKQQKQQMKDRANAKKKILDGREGLKD